MDADAVKTVREMNQIIQSESPYNMVTRLFANRCIEIYWIREGCIDGSGQVWSMWLAATQLYRDAATDGKEVHPAVRAVVSRMPMLTVSTCNRILHEERRRQTDMRAVYNQYTSEDLYALARVGALPSVAETGTTYAPRLRSMELVAAAADIVDSPLYDMAVAMRRGKRRVPMSQFVALRDASHNQLAYLADRYDHIGNGQYDSDDALNDRLYRLLADDPESNDVTISDPIWVDLATSMTAQQLVHGHQVVVVFDLYEVLSYEHMLLRIQRIERYIAEQPLLHAAIGMSMLAP